MPSARRALPLAVVAVVTAAIAGVAAGAGAASQASASLPSVPLPVLTPKTGSEGVPAFKHVFTIVLENEDYTATWGPGSVATYLNGTLRPMGALATNYYGDSHVSADNYMSMTSGQTPTPLFQTDCINWLACETWEKARVDGGVSVADQVEAAGLTWKAYMDGMIGTCVHPSDTAITDPNQTGYATRHDPFVYYPPIVENQARCDAHVVPYGQLASDLGSEASTPNYVFITPDTCHDGHDAPCTGAEAGQPGGLLSADAWLQANVPAILSSPAFADRGVLFITTDEASTTDVSGCCSSGIPPIGVDGGGLIGLLAISAPVAAPAVPLVKVGVEVATPYDHASMLRTVEDGLDLDGYLNNAGSPLEHPMVDLFNAGA